MTFDYTFRSATGHLTILDGSTEIPEDAFHYREQVTSVSIPDSVTKIGDDAFYENSLTEVVIPDSVTSIGSRSFSFNSLTEVIIGNSVTSIGEDAFAWNSLTEVVIGDSVISIGEGAFDGNYLLTEIAIPNSVTSIGPTAFRNNGLTEVVIPDSVISIGVAAFADMYDLTEVVIGDSVTSIGERAFWAADLSEIIIPDSVTTIGKDAFKYNDLLEEVELPEHFKDALPYDAFDFGVNFTFSSDNIPRDLNGDGFVDQITNYQMLTESGGVDLKNRRGKTYSNDSSRMWDAIKAVETNSGFSVLVEGERHKEGKYKVASANDEGLVGGVTRWYNDSQMTNEGYEELFAMDFNGNGVIDLV